jgi:hypothetical protein
LGTWGLGDSPIYREAGIKKMITTIDQYNNNDIVAAPMQYTIEVFFDGLCQPVNSVGIACFSFIVKEEDNTIHTAHGLAAYDSTNNVAEYTGLSIWKKLVK